MTERPGERRPSPSPAPRPPSSPAPPATSAAEDRARTRQSGLRWRTRLRYWRSTGVARRWALYTVGAVVLVMGRLADVTALLARRDAVQIRDRLAQVQAQVAQGDLAGARQTAGAFRPWRTTPTR